MNRTWKGRLRRLWRREPARVLYVSGAVVIFLAGKLGVVLDEQDVGDALGLAGFVLLGGEGIRSQVKPKTR